MHHASRKIRSTKGFTIVEVAIIVPTLILTVIILFNSLFFLVRTSAVSRTKVAMTYDAQAALNIIENDAALTSAFLPTTDINVTDAYKPTTNGGQWSYMGASVTSSTRVLILRAYNTATNPWSPSRVPSYETLEGCDPADIYSNDVAQYNLIYFVDNGNLYRRHALDTTDATCLPLYQKQGCPSLATLGLPSRDSSCQADDELVARDVTAFDIKYYPTKSGITQLDVYQTTSDPDLVTIAEAIDISLTISRNAYGQAVTSTSSIRVAKINASTGD